MTVTDDQLASWHKHGYMVVPGFLTEAEVAAARDNAAAYAPTWEEYERSPLRYKSLLDHKSVLDQGSAFAFFPFAGEALNAICTSSDILDFVGRALGTPDIMMTQSHIWAKYAGAGDFEQNLHVDFDNNTLVYPRDDGVFRQVPMMVYYTDVTLDLGPTCVASQQSTADCPLVGRNIDRDEHPEVYASESAVTVTAGSLLVFSMRTFHRGSAMRADKGFRLTHHIVYRAAGYEWMGYNAWPRFASEPEMRHFIEQATPRQRSVIGFPSVGHEYWNDETIAGVAARYPGMDMSPYRTAFSGSQALRG